MKRILANILVLFCFAFSLPAHAEEEGEAPPEPATEAATEAPAAAAEPPVYSPDEAPAAPQEVAVEPGSTEQPAEAAETRETAGEAGPGAVAENPAPAEDEEPQAIQDQPQLQGADRKAQLMTRLKERLSKFEDRDARFVVLTPLDFTKDKVGGPLGDTLVAELTKFGAAKVSYSSIVLNALTMEEMRSAMIRSKADAIVTVVLKDTNFDLFLYDRRNPFYIYAHSETIEDADVAQMSPSVAVKYGSLLLKRTLARYVNEQYYELPREESSPILQSEIPKWVTSNDSLRIVNRDALSRFSLSANVGMAVVRGTNNAMWSSPLVGVQFGVRVFDRFYVEGTYDTFAYNAFVLDGKYLFANKARLYKLAASFGVAYVTKEKTWIVDETPGLGRQASFFVPGITAQFPISDVYLKVDARVFIAETMDRFLFTFTPGIVAYF